MALFLLTLGLSLVSAQELNPRAVVQKNYDMAKVSGTWYSVSTASDDMKRIEENGDLRLFIQNIESLQDGGLRLRFHFMLHGECEHVAVVCERAEKDGEYTIHYEGDNTVLLLETDYRLYITFYLRNIRNGTETTVLALYGRVLDLGPSFLDRFESICRKHGLGPQNIVSLSHQDPGGMEALAEEALGTGTLLGPQQRPPGRSPKERTGQLSPGDVAQALEGEATVAQTPRRGEHAAQLTPRGVEAPGGIPGRPGTASPPVLAAHCGQISAASPFSPLADQPLEHTAPRPSQAPFGDHVWVVPGGLAGTPGGPQAEAGWQAWPEPGAEEEDDRPSGRGQGSTLGEETELSVP
ncbi:epididymal-specific lipocalin-9 [Crocuta crocuta]